MGGEIGRRIGQIPLEIIDDIHRPVHPPPVPGVGADVWIDARLRGGIEGELLGGLRLEERARHEDISRFRHEGSLGKRRFLGELLRNLTEGLHRARLGDDEVVGHDVGILEDKQHRLARLNGNRLLVVVHPLVDRADADDAHPEIGKLRTPRLPFARREERGEILGELPGSQAGIARALLDGRCPHRFQERVEHRRRLRGGPLRNRDLLEGRDGSITILPLDDKRRDPLEHLVLAAADAGQRPERSPADGGRQSGFLAGNGDLGGAFRCRLAFHLEDFLALAIEDRELEILKAPGEAVAPIKDDDPVDPLRAAEIDLPPRVLDSFLGVGLAVLAIFGVGVAVDRPARLAAGGDVDLSGLAGAGEIVVAGVDLHFGERQRPLRAGKLDADEPADRPRLHGGCSWQAVDEREDAVIEARAHARVAHQRQGLDHVDEPARLRLGQLPNLRARIAAAEGVDRRQRDIANPAQLRPPSGGRHPLHVAPQLGQLAGGPREQHPDQIEHGGRIDGPLAGVELA